MACRCQQANQQHATSDSADHQVRVVHIALCQVGLSSSLIIWLPTVVPAPVADLQHAQCQLGNTLWTLHGQAAQVRHYYCSTNSVYVLDTCHHRLKECCIDQTRCHAHSHTFCLPLAMLCPGFATARSAHCRMPWLGIMRCLHYQVTTRLLLLALLFACVISQCRLEERCMLMAHLIKLVEQEDTLPLGSANRLHDPGASTAFKLLHKHAVLTGHNIGLWKKCISSSLFNLALHQKSASNKC